MKSTTRPHNNADGALAHPSAPGMKHNPALWHWSTYTVCGQRFRFQGHNPDDGFEWYVHVCRLDQGRWLRVSYGWMYGKTLPEVAQSWALAYVSSNDGYPF